MDQTPKPSMKKDYILWAGSGREMSSVIRRRREVNALTKKQNTPENINSEKIERHVIININHLIVITVFTVFKCLEFYTGFT